MPDCAQCVARAVSDFSNLCPRSCGGLVQLQGCFVRYDNVNFLGVEDKTVVFKKCGGGPSSAAAAGYNNTSTEVMELRDAVLGSLCSGGGGGSGGGLYYLIAGSGKVQGVTQCTGDLSMGQCQDCVSEAIRPSSPTAALRFVGTCSWANAMRGTLPQRFLHKPTRQPTPEGNPSPTTTTRVPRHLQPRYNNVFFLSLISLTTSKALSTIASSLSFRATK